MVLQARISLLTSLIPDDVMLVTAAANAQRPGCCSRWSTAGRRSGRGAARFACWAALEQQQRPAEIIKPCKEFGCVLAH